MSDTISMETAHRVWMAHREIEVGKKLLADITEELKRDKNWTPLDPFGRQRRMTLGLPSGNGERLLHVSPKLALYVIEAHIADKEKELAEACVMAKMDLGLLPHG